MALFEINRLGPIDHCSIDDGAGFSVYTGAQASGKSTVAKVIFYFRTVKEDIYSIMERRALEDASSTTNDIKPVSLREELKAYLKEKFLRVFGSSWCMDNEMYISYRYADDVSIKVDLEPGKNVGAPNYVKISLSAGITDFLRRHSGYLKASAVGIPRRQEVYIREKLKDLFRDPYDTCVYIPAGRSILSVLSDQFGYIYSMMNDQQKRLIDYCTKDYLERTLRLRPSFSGGLEKIGDAPGNSAYARQQKALEWIEKILKGRYSFTNGEERIFFDGEKYVKLNFASSGQQESVWILNLLYWYLISGERVLFIIEEPESHLFPDAQKYISELISLVAGNDNAVVLTTHSPYVLGSLNNLLYATGTASYAHDGVCNLIPEEFWLDPDDFSAWFIDHGLVTDAMERDMGMIRNEMIDSISSVINSDFDSMLEMQPMEE